MNFPFKISDSLAYILLPILCVFFDETLKVSRVNRSDILRALVDSSAHGTIAFFSWMAVVGMTRHGVFQSFFCAVFACAIDLDHFIMAKSYSLKDALSLPERPPLHSSSILVPILPITTFIALYFPAVRMLPFLTTVAVVSHHVRDGHRRGMWFWPIGTTPPIPYWGYLVIVVLLPLTLSLMVNRVSRKEISLSNV